MMMSSHPEYVIAALVVSVLLLFLFAVNRQRCTAAVSTGTVLLSCLALLAPGAANAVEFRHGDDLVVVKADEVIGDTLFIAGDTVLVEGTVEGNLFAAGSRVFISGPVHGNLFVAGENVTVSGRVDGMMAGAGATLDLNDVAIAGDLFAAGEKVGVSHSSSVERNALLAGETVAVAGTIGRDLVGAGRSLEVNGRVGENVIAAAERVNLLGNARIGGDLRVHSDDEDAVQRAPTAVVSGQIQFRSMTGEDESREGSLSGGLFLAQVLKWIAALLVGLVLLWLIPGLRLLNVGGAMEGLKTAGIGLLALIGLPVAAVLCAITLIGIPFTIIGLFLWGLSIYLAKIVMAAMLGTRLLGSSGKSDSRFWTLLLGLVIIAVLVNLPFIGGLLNIVLTLLGIGLLVRWTLGDTSRHDRLADNT